MEQAYKIIPPDGRLGPNTPCVVCNGIIPTNESTNRLIACSECRDPYHVSCETSLYNWMSKPYLAMYLWSCSRCVRSQKEAKALEHISGVRISDWETAKSVEVITTGGNVQDTPELAKRMYSIITKTKTSEVGFTGGATFGELIKGSNQRIVTYFQEQCSMDEKSIFFDMGSGLGQPCLHALLASKIKASIGIEVDDDRYRLSMVNLNAMLKDDKLRTEARPEAKTFPCAFIHGNIHSAWSFDPFTHVVMFDKGIPEWTMKHMASMCNASTTLRYITSVHNPATFITVHGFAVRPKARLNAALAGSNSQHMMYVYERILQDTVKSQKAFASARNMDADTIYRFALPDFFARQLATIPYLQDIDRVYRPWVQARVTTLQNSTSLTQGKTRSSRDKQFVNITTKTSLSLPSPSLLAETKALWALVAEQNRVISSSLAELKSTVSAFNSPTFSDVKQVSLLNRLPVDLFNLLLESVKSPTAYALSAASKEYHKLTSAFATIHLRSLTLFHTEDGTRVYPTSVMAKIMAMKKLNHFILDAGKAYGKCIPLIDVMLQTNAQGRYIPHVEIRGSYRYKPTDFGDYYGEGGSESKERYAYQLVRRLDISDWNATYDSSPLFERVFKGEIKESNDTRVEALIDHPMHLQVLNMTNIKDAFGYYLQKMMRFSEWTMSTALTVLQLEFNNPEDDKIKRKAPTTGDYFWTTLSKRLQTLPNLQVVSLKGEAFHKCQAGKIIVTIAANCPQIRVIRLHTTRLTTGFDLVNVLKRCVDLRYLETTVDETKSIQRTMLDTLVQYPNLLTIRAIVWPQVTHLGEYKTGEEYKTERQIDSLIQDRVASWLKTQAGSVSATGLDLPIVLNPKTYDNVYNALVEQSIPTLTPPSRDELKQLKEIELEYPEMFPNGTVTPPLPEPTAATVVNAIEHEGKGEKRKFDNEEKIEDKTKEKETETVPKRIKTYDDDSEYDYNAIDPSKPIDIERLFKMEAFGQGGQAIRLTTRARYSTRDIAYINSVIDHDDTKGLGKSLDKSTVRYGYTRLFNDARSQLGNYILGQWERGMDQAEAKAKRDINGRLIPGWDAHVPSQQDVEDQIRDQPLFEGETHPLSRLALPSYDCDLGPQFRDGALIRRVFESIIVHPNVDATKPEIKKYKSEHPRPMDVDAGGAGVLRKARPCYVSLGSGTLFEDLAILDQLVKSGRLVDRIVLIDRGYGNLSKQTLAGRYKPILQFMTWFNSYPQLAERGFDVIVYSHMSRYLFDLESELKTSGNGKSTLQADIFIVADVHFTLGSQPQVPPFADLSFQSVEQQYEEGRNLEARHRIERMNHRDYQGYPFDKARLQRILKQDGVAYWLANQIVKLPVQYREISNSSWSGTSNDWKRSVVIAPMPEIAFGIVSVSIADGAVPKTQLYSVEKRYYVDDTFQQFPSWHFAEPRSIDMQEWVIL